MFIIAKPNSLSVVMMVRKYPLTTLKSCILCILFFRSLSAEVTSTVQPIRSNRLILGTMLVNEICICVFFLWRKRFSFIEQQRLNLVINTLHLRLTVFILSFLTLAVLI